jgi:hypothetical protein
MKYMIQLERRQIDHNKSVLYEWTKLPDMKITLSADACLDDTLQYHSVKILLTE